MLWLIVFRQYISNKQDTENGWTNCNRVSKMKSLARSYVWWPGLDSDIETEVHWCKICQLHHSMPSKAHLHLWELPSRPWVSTY